MPSAAADSPAPEAPQWGKPDCGVDVLRARLRAQSKTVSTHVGSDPEAKAFMDDWATPDPTSH